MDVRRTSRDRPLEDVEAERRHDRDSPGLVIAPRDHELDLRPEVGGRRREALQRARLSPTSAPPGIPSAGSGSTPPGRRARALGADPGRADALGLHVHVACAWKNPRTTAYVGRARTTAGRLVRVVSGCSEKAASSGPRPSGRSGARNRRTAPGVAEAREPWASSAVVSRAGRSAPVRAARSGPERPSTRRSFSTSGMRK